MTKLDRDPASGTALQEISFWLNLERALYRIQEKRESPEVLLTLDILKHGKRFHATVSFDTDTGNQLELIIWSSNYSASGAVLLIVSTAIGGCAIFPVSSLGPRRIFPPGLGNADDFRTYPPFCPGVLRTQPVSRPKQRALGASLLSHGYWAPWVGCACLMWSRLCFWQPRQEDGLH